ncbi:MAG: hypothetical protein A2284_02200 [Deltaproteobacteria bacterium RIFOXYA12_FULL_61_11]|nr:MAG: hypothetical protein A2284_02200 [Deltaproteobacteria bacterium RIFOXYA12_FULL_61_11]
MFKVVVAASSGWSYVRQGFKAFGQFPELRPLVVLPLVVNFSVLLLLLSFFSWKFNDLFDWMLAILPEFELAGEGFLIGLLNVFLLGLFYIFKAFAWLLLLIMTILCFFLMAAVINAPFHDLIAERVERRCAIRPAEEQTLGQLLASTPRLMFNELKKAVFFLLVPLLLLVLNLVPGFGSLVYVVAVNVTTAWIQGYVYTDFAMVRHGYGFREGLRFALGNPAALISFGVPTLVPFFVFFCSPALVAGGTLLFLDRTGNLRRGDEEAQL